MSDDLTPGEAQWQDWAAVAAADLGEPTFEALVGEIGADPIEPSVQPIRR